MRICFRLILSVGVAAGLAPAADPAGQPKRVVTVVRSDPHTGKLVRTVLVTSKAANPKPTAPVPADAAGSLDEAVRLIATQNALPPELLQSVIKVESNYNPLAVSAKGAQGMMQLVPATARRFGVANTFNPVENIEGGAKYLRYLLDLYNGDHQLALAAYNAGEQAVARYGGVPPYRETQNYVVRVSKHLKAAKTGDQPESPAMKPGAANAAASSDAAGVPAHIREIREPDGSVRYVSR